MKKAIFALCMLATLAACSDDSDIIWDAPAFKFQIDIVDEEGTNMVAPGGALHGENFTVELDGKVFNCDWDWEYPDSPQLSQSRLWPAFYRDFFFEKNINALVFGEFDGQSDFDMHMVLTLPNGQTHELSLQRKSSPNKLKHKFRLDGKVIKPESSILYHCTIVVK